MLAVAAPAQAAGKADTVLFNDSHFHLTNYVQEGLSIREYLAIMGDKIGRSTLYRKLHEYGLAEELISDAA